MKYQEEKRGETGKSKLQISQLNTVIIQGQRNSEAFNVIEKTVKKEPKNVEGIWETPQCTLKQYE